MLIWSWSQNVMHLGSHFIPNVFLTYNKLYFALSCHNAYLWHLNYFYSPLYRFLWRKNATFAISKHYRRFDVFVEAEANKAAAKYDNASIDFQIEFYKKEGLTPYTEAKLPLISG